MLLRTGASKSLRGSFCRAAFVTFDEVLLLLFDLLDDFIVSLIGFFVAAEDDAVEEGLPITDVVVKVEIGREDEPNLIPRRFLN